MFDFIQYITEIHDIKPKVQLIKPLAHSSNITTHHQNRFIVSHPSLKKDALITTVHKSGEKHAEINISSEGGSYDHMGNLGPRHVMHVLGRIKHHLPDIETLKGKRVTGAREKLDNSDPKKETEMSIKHIKPIPPE